MQSLTARILARASGKSKVEPGEVVIANVDKIVLTDATGPMAVDILEKLGVRLTHPADVYIFLDHYSPSPSISASNIHIRLRKFAKAYRVPNLFDVGEGISHQIMVEGIVRPGEVVVGADSHTTQYGALAAFATGVGSSEAAYAMVMKKLWFKAPEPLFIKLTGSLPPYASGKDVILSILSTLGPDGANYRALEFLGPGLKSLSMSERLTIANMSVEGGAKNAIFPLDDIVIGYFEELGISLDLERLGYLKEPAIDKFDYTVDLSTIEPMVAKPHNPANSVPVSEVEGVKIDVAFIASCANGKYEDLVVASRILKGRKVSKDVRLIVTPASKRVLVKALQDGLIQILLEAGAIVTPPGCGACFGANLGVVGDYEVAISSTTRNFTGRMGSPKAQVYLASPATVAASAIEGCIADPRRYLR